MKKVFQEIFDARTGDCLSAALASLLEIPLESVPKFNLLAGDPYKGLKSAREWLATEYRLSLVDIQMEDLEKPGFTGFDLRLIGAVPGTLCIAGGASANVEGANHAVVGQIDSRGLNFEILHDPNPLGKGIVGRPSHLYFLIPLDYRIFKKVKDEGKRSRSTPRPRRCRS